MIRKITVQLTIIHLLFSSDATFNNKSDVSKSCFFKNYKQYCYKNNQYNCEKI